MNPIACFSVEPLPEPRGESPTSGAIGDADSAEFGLALALAAAAQPQAVPLPVRPVAAGLGGTPLPALPAGPEATALAPLPVAARDAQAGFPSGGATPDPSRSEPARARATPAGPAGNADAPATPVVAGTATVAPDASPRTNDLPLNFRVLELVRGMTEQAARAALDTAVSAGPAQGGPVPVPATAERGRDRSAEVTWDGDGTARAVSARVAEASAAARAPVANESVPVSAGPGSPVPPSVCLRAGSAEPAAGAERASTVPPEARASARPGDQVTLHFSGEDGLEGKLRVAVRGQNVRATILSDDPGAAERFSRGLGDLQRALHERGFSEARLNVQHTARSEGPASGTTAREDARNDPRPRGEGRDGSPSSRQERESASTEEHPRRRPPRPRTER